MSDKARLAVEKDNSLGIFLSSLMRPNYAGKICPDNHLHLHSCPPLPLSLPMKAFDLG